MRFLPPRSIAGIESHPPRDERRPTPSLAWMAVTRFAHEAEVECARALDALGIRWAYEPHMFVLSRDDAGRIREAITPDFHLPDL